MSWSLFVLDNNLKIDFRYSRQQKWITLMHDIQPELYYDVTILSFGYVMQFEKVLGRKVKRLVSEWNATENSTRIIEIKLYNNEEYEKVLKIRSGAIHIIQYQLNPESELEDEELEDD